MSPCNGYPDHILYSAKYYKYFIEQYYKSFIAHKKLMYRMKEYLFKYFLLLLQFCLSFLRIVRLWYTVENFDASIECTFLTCLVVMWSVKMVLIPCLNIANG